MEKNFFFWVMVGCFTAAALIILYLAWQRRQQTNTATTASSSASQPQQPSPPTQLGTPDEEVIEVTELTGIAITSQKSLLIGILVSLAVATFLDWALNFFFVYVFGQTYSAPFHFLVVLALGSLIYLWGLHNVGNGEQGWRGAILIFNHRALRDGAGLSEGWQWVLRPFMSIKDVDCREKQLDISDEEGSYTKDGPRMSISGYIRYAVVNVYRFLGKDDAVTSVQGLTKQTMRTQLKKISAIDARNMNYADFSDIVARDLNRQLAEKGNPRGVRWGLDTGIVVVEDVWATEEKLSEAWGAKSREEAEGEAEALEATRRNEQAKTFLGLHPEMDPEFALGAALTNAGKAGATTTNVNINAGVERLAGALKDLLVGIVNRKGN